MKILKHGKVVIPPTGSIYLESYKVVDATRQELQDLTIRRLQDALYRMVVSRDAIKGETSGT